MIELARNTDPRTSHAAVPSERSRDTQCLRLLEVFEARELTSWESWNTAGVEDGWRRVSDLKNTGLVRPTGELRQSRGCPSRKRHEVLAITPKGEAVLAGEEPLILAPQRRGLRAEVAALKAQVARVVQYADDLADELEEAAPGHPLLEEWDSYRNAL